MSGEAFTRITDALSERGYRVTVKGTKAKSQCPCHDDNNPSLDIAINDANDGVVMLCRSQGCANGEIVRAIGLTLASLYDQPRTSTANDCTWYPYADAGGVVRYHKYRKWPKTFGYADAERRVFKKPRGQPSLLYRLPDVMKAVANGDEVWIPEGEKDADALVRAGVCATTNDGGAGKWSSVEACANEHLLGARVVVTCDRDEAGYAHAKDKARRLRGVAASIRVVEPKAGKDAFDHLAAGFGIEDFVPLATTDDELAAWLDEAPTDDDQPPTDDDAVWNFIDWQQLLNDETHEEWLVQDMWPVRRHVHVHAVRKTGKSLVSLWVACCLAIGRDPLTGEPQAPVVVLYLDYEMTPDDVKERVLDMGFNPDQLTNLRYALFPAIDALDTKTGGETLLNKALAVGATVVILDTLSRVVEGDENSNDTYIRFFRFTGKLLKQHGIALFRLDHEGHTGGRSRGASAKADDVDVVFQLKRTDNGFQFVRGPCRVSLIPATINIVFVDDGESSLMFKRTDAVVIPNGTMEKVDDLNLIGAPVDIGYRTAGKLLKDAGKTPGKNDVLRAAVAYRKRNPMRGFM